MAVPNYSHSRANASNTTTSAHRFSANQPTVLLTRLRSHDTMPLMRPGSADAAFPASWASIHPRAFKCFFAHFLRPPLSAGGGGVGATGAAGTPAPPPVRASTRVEIANTIAVRIDAIVTPCSQNRIRNRSARGLFLSKTLDMVSRIWRTCDRSCWLRASMLSWTAVSWSSAF